MAVFKCKICGGQTTIDSQNGIATCEYCGTKQVPPLFSEDSERLLYESGNNYLNHSEYDKAENVFNQLLTIKPGAAELYWDLVLCKYGVTYVKDPKSGKYIPTCNRTHYTPIFSDENYKKAIELSSGEKKTLFEEDAKTIDNIQRGIIAVSKKEKPFDIFISYKETDANGNRTKDSVEAQKLYEKLTEAGYKVFFSRITLEDKIGTEYEPYIYAALYSSKVMLTICSSKENIEAVWVKNEWSRFLGFRQNDNSKTLLPLYFGMEKSDLPEEFALLSAYDMSTDGFVDELLRGIKKLIPRPISKAEQMKRIGLAVAGVFSAVLVASIVLSVIFIPQFLENSKADREQQAQAKAEQEQLERYNSAVELFEKGEYTEAEAAFIALGDYKDSAKMAARCSLQSNYDAAMQLYYDGKYAQATWAFEALGDYEDSAEQKEKAELSWRNMLSTRSTGIYYTDENKYYINENGSVGIRKGETGGAHLAVDIKENGKVSSIIKNGEYARYYSNLTVLHENGCVTHAELDDELANNPDNYDIIKVSETFRREIIGLRADGKMVVLVGDSNYFSDLLEWTDIVDFKENCSPSQSTCCGLIIGLKADGTFCVAQYSEGLRYDMDAVGEIFSKFSNVKNFDFSSGLIFSGGNSQQPAKITILALTNDNKLLTYKDGEFSESNGKDICDIITLNIVLQTNGDLVNLVDSKVLLRDIVYAGGSSHIGYAITRTGNIAIFSLYNGQTKVDQTGSKTIVCEEWVSRLN